MKHLFIALTIAAASVFNTVNASDPVTPPVLESFRNSYSDAKEIKWKDIGNVYKVSFKMDGKYADAYYMVDGSWIGTARNIKTSELPYKQRASLRRELKKGGFLSDLFILSGSDGNIYFATIETPDAKKVFKSNSGRKWSLYKNIEK
jgi:hypothetical protein